MASCTSERYLRPVDSIVATARSRGLAEPLAQSSVGQHAAHGLGQRRRVAGRYQQPRLANPSDRCDPAWSGVRPRIVPARLRGRPCPEQRWREYLDAILSVVRTGCP